MARRKRRTVRRRTRRYRTRKYAKRHSRRRSKVRSRRRRSGGAGPRTLDELSTHEAPPAVDAAYLADRYGGDYGNPKPRPWVGSRLRKWIGSKVKRRRGTRHRGVRPNDDIEEQEDEWTKQWQKEDEAAEAAKRDADDA